MDMQLSAVEKVLFEESSADDNGRYSTNFFDELQQIVEESSQKKMDEDHQLIHTSEIKNLLFEESSADDRCYSSNFFEELQQIVEESSQKKMDEDHQLIHTAFQSLPSLLCLQQQYQPSAFQSLPALPCLQQQYQPLAFQSFPSLPPLQQHYQPSTQPMQPLEYYNNDEWMMKLLEIETEMDGIVPGNQLTQTTYESFEFQPQQQQLLPSIELLELQPQQDSSHNSNNTMRSSSSSSCEEAKKRRRKRTPSANFPSLIATGVVSVGDRACYVNKRQKRVVKEGCIMREGIHCNCCQKIYTVSAFEVHAGANSHRPAANILLADGRSLRDLQAKL